MASSKQSRPDPKASEWFNTQMGLRPWKTAIDQFSQMARPQVVFDAAKSAGQVFKTSMQDIIYGQPSLRDYGDVAERITVWGEVGDNVYVGIPEGTGDAPPVDITASIVYPGSSSLVVRANDMDSIFPVLHTAIDFERQTHDTERAFETNLIQRVF